MNNPYNTPESDVAVNTGAQGDLGKIESRRSIMMKTFLATIVTVIIAIVLMAVGGESGAAIGLIIYVGAIIVGLVNFVFMLMLTSSLHGGGWVAGNLVGSLIIPFYSLVAVLMLNSQAKKRLAGAAA